MSSGGHAHSSSDHDVEGPPHRYRIKRRNASVGDNINVFNHHLRESANRAGGQASLNALHRTRGGRIEGRPSGSNRFYSNPHANNNNQQQSRFTKDNRINPQRWLQRNGGAAEGEFVKRNDPNFKPREKLLERLGTQGRITNKPGLPKELRSYKIGEEGPTTQLAASKPHCKLATMQDGVFELIVKFLKQYFECYDKNRVELLAAYHPKALFSLSLNVKSQATPPAQKFGDFFRDSRNLHHLMNEEKRFNTIQKSNLDTVALISKMPPTEHEVDSFKLDTTFYSPMMLAFSITGVFREGKSDDKIRPYRSFQRSFICVPTSNDQMAIVNEQYLISNLTYDQAKAYKSEMATKFDDPGQFRITIRNDTVTSKPPLQPLMQQQPMTSAQSSQEDVRTKAVLQFAQASNLTLEWAKYCLEYAGWDLAQAEKAFKENFANIPKEAFNQP